MPNVYLVPDPYFFTPEVSSQYGLYVDEYNNKIITNLLTCMESGDEFLFFGELGGGSFTAMEKLLAPLNPTKTCILIDGREQTHLSQQDYRKLFHQVWNCPGIHRGTYKDKFYTFLISPAKHGLKFDLEQRGEAVYVVTTESKYETGCLIKDKVYNASIHLNNLMPTALKSLPERTYNGENNINIT